MIKPLQDVNSKDKERQEMLHRLRLDREKKIETWKIKTRNSPFAVNLAADHERLQEESDFKMKQSIQYRQELTMQKEQIKSNIFLKALSEFSELEALREEKRAILEEEKRLRALLALEKSRISNNYREERYIAERGLRHRVEEKNKKRRDLYKESLDRVLNEESMALKYKHGLHNSQSLSSMSSSFQ